jgi:prepilin-type N-terminal cleavage/methylation domain-containing protein
VKNVMRKDASPRLPLWGQAGFTLIEMLVVVAIILLLLTIGVIGFRSMERSSSEKQTKVNLTNAEALLKQMTAVGILPRLQGPNDYQPTPLYPFDNNNVSQPIDPPVNQTVALQNCRSVTRVMMQHPEVKKAILALPSQMIATPPTGTTADPALIDAWGFALIFVPSGGLRNVQVEGAAAGSVVTVTSSGFVPSSTVAPNPQNRPFWVSPGPDGKYETGADNLYSFQMK